MAIKNNRDYEVALHFFHEGSATEAYEFFGSHFCEQNEKKGSCSACGLLTQARSA